MYKRIIFKICTYFSLSFFVLINIVIWCKNKINKCFGENNIYTYKSILTNKEIPFICFVIMLILSLFILDIYLLIKKAKIEKKGIKFKVEDGTFGTANWMNSTELTNSFEVGTGNGLIVGKNEEGIITLPNDTKQNKNIAIFGASGSRKSIRICYTQYIKLSSSRKINNINRPQGRTIQKNI